LYRLKRKTAVCQDRLRTDRKGELALKKMCGVFPSPQAYQAQMAMQQAMEQTRQEQAARNGGGVLAAGAAGGGGAPTVRLLVVLTAAWLAKDVASKLFRARL
jgi:hypothetical protein